MVGHKKKRHYNSEFLLTASAWPTGVLLLVGHTGVADVLPRCMCMSASTAERSPGDPDMGRRCITCRLVKLVSLVCSFVVCICFFFLQSSGDPRMWVYLYKLHRHRHRHRHTQTHTHTDALTDGESLIGEQIFNGQIIFDPPNPCWAPP